MLNFGGKIIVTMLTIRILYVINRLSFCYFNVNRLNNCKVIVIWDLIAIFT